MRTKLFLGLFASFLSATAVAQDQQQHVKVCNDKVMHTELVMLDKSLEERGFHLVQFNTMNMPSGSYLPVTVSMKEGKMYQINFIANKNFKQYNVTILDKDRKKLMDKTVKQKNGGSNQLSESFAAPYSGNYFVILSQKVKGQDEACGGISILEAGMSQTAKGKK